MSLNKCHLEQCYVLLCYNYLNLNGQHEHKINTATLFSDTQGEQKDEASSIAIAIIGAGVTAVLVSILVITTAVSTCAIMSVYKKRRQALQSTEHANKEEELDDDSLEM